jgi:hypothetical protein
MKLQSISKDRYRHMNRKQKEAVSKDRSVSKKAKVRPEGFQPSLFRYDVNQRDLTEGFRDKLLIDLNYPDGVLPSYIYLLPPNKIPNKIRIRALDLRLQHPDIPAAAIALALQAEGYRKVSPNTVRSYIYRETHYPRATGLAS